MSSVGVFHLRKKDKATVTTESAPHQEVDIEVRERKGLYHEELIDLCESAALGVDAS